MPATNFMLSINLSSDDAADRRRGRIPPAERVFWRRPHFVFFGASLIPRSLSRVESGWWRSHVRPDQTSSSSFVSEYQFHAMFMLLLRRPSIAWSRHPRSCPADQFGYDWPGGGVPEHHAVTVITKAREGCIHFKVAAPSHYSFEVSTRTLYFQPVSFLYMYINNYGKRAPLYQPVDRSCKLEYKAILDKLKLIHKALQAGSWHSMFPCRMQTGSVVVYVGTLLKRGPACDTEQIESEN